MAVSTVDDKNIQPDSYQVFDMFFWILVDPQSGSDKQSAFRVFGRVRKLTRLFYVLNGDEPF